jgi:hypothetical protein
MARSFGTGQVVYVSYLNGTKYFFRSRLKSSLRDIFGQVAVTDWNSVDVQKAVVAPQFPKPRIGTVQDATEGLENSYVANPLPPKFDGSTKRGSKYKSLVLKGRRQRLVYVTINGIKYGWYLNESIPDSALGTLGIKLATENDTDILLSPDFPKPPRVKNISNKVKKWTTFCDPSVIDTLNSEANASKWQIIDQGLSTLNQLQGVLGINPQAKNESDSGQVTV